MSGFAFSPHFSQRWFETSNQIKQAIINELTDIHTLLQPETDLLGFKFRVNNLHETVDIMLREEKQAEAERAAKQQEEEARRRELDRLERERQRKLGQERIERERQQKLEQERQAQIEAEQHSLMEQYPDTLPMMGKDNLGENDLAQIKQQIMANLSKKLDDYLMDAMATMQTDLQNWLSEEVDSQLRQKLGK